MFDAFLTERRTWTGAEVAYVAIRNDHREGDPEGVFGTGSISDPYDGSTFLKFDNLINTVLRNKTEKTDVQIAASFSGLENFSVKFPFTSSFLYSPEKGQLVMDFGVLGPVTGTTLSTIDVEGYEGRQTKGYLIFGQGEQFNKASGVLVTEFEYAVVPEPNTLYLVTVGIFALLKQKKTCQSRGYFPSIQKYILELENAVQDAVMAI